MTAPKNGPRDSGQFRLGDVSLPATGIGCLSGVIAYILYNSTGLITNFAFYRIWSAQFPCASETQLGLWSDCGSSRRWDDGVELSSRQ